MLDLGPDAGFAPVGFPVSLGQWRIAVRPPVGEVLCLRGDLLETLPPRLAPVGTVTVKPGSGDERRNRR